MPLGEESERYEVEVLNGTVVARTLAAAAPAVLYSTTSELADFGSAQATLSLRLYQLSATIGRGYERAVTVAVI